MPCSDGGYIDNSRVIDNTDYAKIASQKALINKLESMLCSACRVLEKSKFDFDENPRLSEWWDTHKKQDAKRELAQQKARLEKEQAAEIAQKKFCDLTKEDRVILKKFGYL